MSTILSPRVHHNHHNRVPMRQTSGFSVDAAQKSRKNGDDTNTKSSLVTPAHDKDTQDLAICWQLEVSAANAFNTQLCEFVDTRFCRL